MWGISPREQFPMENLFTGNEPLEMCMSGTHTMKMTPERDDESDRERNEKGIYVETYPLEDFIDCLAGVDLATTQDIAECIGGELSNGVPKATDPRGSRRGRKPDAREHARMVAFRRRGRGGGMSGATRSVAEVTGLVGYDLIRRENGALEAERIFDTEPDGPVVGEILDQELQLENGDKVIEIISASEVDRNQ